LLFWLLRPEFDNMRDGLVYGALVGLGFTWYEAALYVVNVYAKIGVAAYGLQLGARYALLGLGGHALFTGLFGASLGFALQTRRRWLRILAPIAGLALAIAAHMLNNALPLFATLTRIAAGKPPPESEQIPDVGFFQAFATDSLIQLNDICSVLAHHGACGLAKRRLGTTRDPRGTRKRNRAFGHTG